MQLWTEIWKINTNEVQNNHIGNKKKYFYFVVVYLRANVSITILEASIVDQTLSTTSLVYFSVHTEYPTLKAFFNIECLVLNKMHKDIM